MALKILRQETEFNGIELLCEKLKTAHELYSVCEHFQHIHGATKLQKKIKAELHFLQKLSKDTENININHLKSSNLPHLAAVVECISRFDGVVKLLTPFSYDDASSTIQTLKRIVVDVVADYGKTWIKVVARNPDALLLLSKGAGKFGRKSLVEQVKELIDCTKQNEHLFHPPSIKLAVVENIDSELLESLRKMNVEVLALNQENCRSIVGSCMQNIVSPSELKQNVPCPKKISSTNDTPNSLKLIDTISEIENLDFHLPLSAISEDMVLNLDVSCLLAYIANMTNGFCHVKLKDTILSEQAEREAVSPIKPRLDKLFEGRKLVCCKSAYTRFVDIFTVIGGTQEKQRAKEFLSRVAIVTDNPSVRCMQLQEVGKINKNSKIIFGTGDSLKAITVAANVGFARAAMCQGEKFVVYLHESRALSEVKEIHDG